MKKNTLLNVLAVSFGIAVSLAAIEMVLRVQTFIKLDGFQDESPWHSVFHHGDDSLEVSYYGEKCKHGKIKLLLLGDSWMEDKYLSNTIGKEFADKTGKCVQTVNGSNSSYAPTLYLLKARQAYEKFGKFDYIIVNIDETDIGDEWFRIRIPMVRDRSGKIVAVPYENDLYARMIWKGKLWAESSNLYIIRLLRFTFYYKALVPLIYSFTFNPEYSNWMKFVFAPDGSSRYKREIMYFKTRLLEMAAKISRFAGEGAETVYITHHPHLRGFVDAIDDGRPYLPVVSDAIAGLPEKTGVKVLDARNNIKEIHGENFPSDTYVAGDPFSHLDADGAVRYGEWIVQQLDYKAENRGI